jgi:hypothetical protein
MRLLWLFCLCRAASSVPSYANDIPNGSRFPAAGHASGAAGGRLSAFGRDFAATQGNWASLCRLDSDGDGETNGQELDDPCCRWPHAQGWAGGPGGALSDPSDASSLSGAVPCPAAELELVAASAPVTAVDPEATDVISRVEPLPEPPQWWHYFSALALVALLLKSGGREVAVLLETRVLVATALGAAVWAELAGGVVHILLDNPALRSWGGFVGPLATQFQEHHEHPASISAEPCVDFLVKYAPIMAVFSFALRALRPQSLRCRAFILFANVFWHLSLFAHRWAHAPVPAEPGRGEAAMLPVRLLQRAHLLMSPEHHEVHHHGFDTRFAMLHGAGNHLLLDPMLVILPSKSLLWGVVLLVWAVAIPFAMFGPAGASSPGCSAPFVDARPALGLGGLPCTKERQHAL